MNLSLKVKRKYAVYCPSCKAELYWNAAFKDIDILECKVCKMYFKFYTHDKKLEKDENYNKIINDLKKSTKGNYVEQFNKTSDYYSPNWLKKIMKKNL
jgi:protein-arginine kinase activator protein McsA